MAITYLPKAGGITEKKYADYWKGAWNVNGIWGGNFLWGDVGNPLASSGLDVFVNNVLGSYFPIVIDGYAVRITAEDDLKVTLPANSRSYIYIVLDMGGGGTNTVGQRMVYYNSPVYLPYGVLIGIADTNATSVSSITYYCNKRPPVFVYQYNSSSIFADMSRAANTERTTTSTDAVLMKKFAVEYAGVITISADMKRSAGTATAYVYCDSTGLSSPQQTFTATTNTYATKTGQLVVAEADNVYVYLKSSNASYTAYIDDVKIYADVVVPPAPAFLLK